MSYMRDNKHIYLGFLWIPAYLLDSARMPRIALFWQSIMLSPQTLKEDIEQDSEDSEKEKEEQKENEEDKLIRWLGD